MAPLEHHPNNLLSYFKIAFKLGVFCFVLSVIVLGSIKILSKKSLDSTADPTSNLVVEEAIANNTKSIEDFEKSGLLKGLFKKEDPVNLKKSELSLEQPEKEPAPQQVETTPQVPSLEKPVVEDKEIAINEDHHKAEVTSTDNQIFNFDSSKNYQGKIASYIAKLKIANLNAEELATIIITESQEIKINPIVTTLLINQESQFNRYSENSNGRVGLLQIHPNEAKLITKKIDLPFLGVVSLYHPIYNIRLGLQLLLEKKESTGSWEGAIKNFSKLKDPNQSAQYLERILTQTLALEQ